MASVDARSLSKEELLESLQEEVENIKAVYSDYDVVVQEPMLLDGETDVSDDVEDDFLIKNVQDSAQVSLVLDIKPATGFDADKNGLLAHCLFEFAPKYPFVAPTMDFVVRKGLEQE